MKDEQPSVKQAHRQLAIAEEKVRDAHGDSPAAFVELGNAYQTYLQSRVADTLKRRQPFLQRLFLGDE